MFAERCQSLANQLAASRLGSSNNMDGLDDVAVSTLRGNAVSVGKVHFFYELVQFKVHFFKNELVQFIVHNSTF